MKRFFFFTVTAYMSCMCAAVAHASDSRIRWETYDRTRVYDIYFKSGRAALIQLESDEVLTDGSKATFGIGDTKAWNLGVRGNNIMLKPVGEQPATNLVVATNKRTYAFELKNAKDVGQVTYILKFSYPDTEEANSAAEKQPVEVIAAIKPLIDSSVSTTSARLPSAPLISPSPEIADAIAPVAIPAIRFTVETQERTVMEVFERWAKSRNIEFSWLADIDYPLNRRMRAIESRSLSSAVAEMRSALRNARLPLDFSLDEKNLTVVRAKPVNDDAHLHPIQPAGPVVDRVSIAAVAEEKKSSPSAASAMSIVKRPWDTAARIASGAFTPHWDIGRETSLRGIVEAWARNAGVRIQWESTSDHALTDAVRSGQYRGTFKEALGQLASRFGEFSRPLGMKFLSNGTVLRIYDMPPT